MSRSLQATLAGCALALVALLVARGCASAADAPAAQPVAADVATAAAAARRQAAAADEAAAAQALAARRDAALQSAVSTLHRYFAAVGGDDRTAADAFWVNGRPPAATGEADLRQLSGLRALRSQNGTPVALDGATVPDALEIPVDLRASVQGEPLRHYAGSYRLRRRVADAGWDITSAALVPRER